MITDLPTTEEKNRSWATLGARLKSSWMIEGRVEKDAPVVAVSMTALSAYIKEMLRTESHIYVITEMIKT